MWVSSEVTKPGRSTPVAGSGADRALSSTTFYSPCASEVCVVFVALSNTDAYEYDRYLTPLVVFSSVLAGRVVGNLANSIGSRLAGRVVAVVGAVVVVAFALGTTLGITGTAVPVAEFAGVVGFLEQRHLDLGIGDYLDASIITVATAGKVTVRPVTGEPTGRSSGISGSRAPPGTRTSSSGSFSTTPRSLGRSTP